MMLRAIVITCWLAGLICFVVGVVLALHELS